MGKKSRLKWMVRAETYQGLVEKRGPNASKEYMDQFGRKLDKFMKGIQELHEDEEEEAEEEREVDARESKDDAP